jgi:hypothetical protein
MAAARMVGMGVRDDGAPDRPPRVDEEVAGRAVQPLRPLDHEIVAHRLVSHARHHPEIRFRAQGFWSITGRRKTKQ